MNAKRFETVTYTAPDHWASYWINGDASGFDESNTPDDPKAGDREQREADEALEIIGLGAPVDCSENEFDHNPDFGLAGDCCTYTFLREVKP